MLLLLKANKLLFDSAFSCVLNGVNVWVILLCIGDHVKQSNLFVIIET